MNEPTACNLLLIDDDPDHTRLVTLIISRRYKDKIRIATSGSQGIELARQAPPDLMFVRLMLMDIDGYEICRRIKANPILRQIPILLFAAKQPQEVYPEAQRCGAAGYLYEPFHPDMLCTARDALLRGDTYYPPLTS